MKKRYLLTSLLILFIGLLGLQSCKQETPEIPPEVLSSEKSILSYSVKIEDVSFEGIIDSEKKEIVIKDIPYDSDISELKPIFTISKEAKISIGGKVQESGVSVVDFSEPVIYTVTAQDKSTAEWTVKLIKKERPSYTVIFHKNYPNSEEDSVFERRYYENDRMIPPELELDDSWIFLGWNSFKDSETAYYYCSRYYTVTRNMELWGIWAKNTANYTVNIFKQNLDDSYSEEPNEIVKSIGYVGTKIEYNISKYTEYELDSDKTNEASIGADGKSVFNIYLKRKIVSYKVNFYFESPEGTYPETPDETKTLTGKFGADAEYDISSYTKFTLDEDKTVSAKISADGSTSVDIYLKRKPATYIVQYYKAKIDQTYADTEDDSVTCSGLAGADVVFDSKKYFGFEIDEDKTNVKDVKISEDNSTVVKVYYKRIEITVKVYSYFEDVNGKYPISPEETSSYNTVYNEDLVITAPEKTGFEKLFDTLNFSYGRRNENVYSFIFYYNRKEFSYSVNYYIESDDSDSYVLDSTETKKGKYESLMTYNENKYGSYYSFEKVEYSSTNKTISGSSYVNVYYKRAELNYSVKYYIEDVDSDSYVLDSTTIKKGKYGTLMQYEEKDFGEHISFEKVEYSSTNKTISGSSYVNVYYKRAEVTFTYKWNIEGRLDTEIKYKYGQSISSPYISPRTLYTFEGWTPSIPSVAETDSVFEAQWTSLAGTSSRLKFIKDLPKAIYIKTPVEESNIHINAYATHEDKTYYQLYTSNDGINWELLGTPHSMGTYGNYVSLGLPATIRQDGKDCYYCMEISHNDNGPYSYSNVCRIVTNSQETENIGSYYYSDGTYSVELDSEKTVVGIVAAVKDDKSPKMIIPVNFSTSSGIYTKAENACNSYSYQGITDWSLPDFIELETILFNAKAINDSLAAINSSLIIHTSNYGQNTPVFYWAKKEIGNSNTNSMAVSIYPSRDIKNIPYYFELQERGTTMNGYYLPVKVLE